MKLLRILLTPVAALAIASPAVAQFNQNATSSSDVALFLPGGLNRPIQMTLAPGNPVLDAFCVDFSNHVNSLLEPVNLTRFDASAAEFNANTRFGFGDVNQYKKAAWLTQFFSTPLTVSQTGALHVAIWHLFTTNQPTCCGTFPPQFQTDYAAWNGLLTGGQWASINTKYWFVISDVNTSHGTTGPELGNQEFITMVAPEPSAIILLGTGMLGIVGLAAHRRKK